MFTCGIFSTLILGYRICNGYRNCNGENKSSIVCFKTLQTLFGLKCDAYAFLVVMYYEQNTKKGNQG